MSPLIARFAAALAVLAAGLAAAVHFTGNTPGGPRSALVDLTTPAVSGAAAPKFFGTLPPGAKLPSSAQCAAWVRAQPSPHESKAVNKPYNQRTGAPLPADFLASDAPAADQRIVPRVNGNFTGSTREILRWVAASGASARPSCSPRRRWNRGGGRPPRATSAPTPRPARPATAR